MIKDIMEEEHAESDDEESEMLVIPTATPR